MNQLATPQTDALNLVIYLDDNMTPNQQCKQAGLTLAELVSLTGLAVSTLKDWHKSNQVKFCLAIDAALYRREK